MLQSSFYQSSALTIQKKENPSLTFHRHLPSTVEHTLLTSIFHMLLGLPSDIFPLQNGQFKINLELSNINHLSSSLLLSEINFFVLAANKLNRLHEAASSLGRLPQRILQALVIGIQDVDREMREQFGEKLFHMRQQEGKLMRNQQELMRSKQLPTTFLHLRGLLEPQLQKLNCISNLLYHLSSVQSTNNDNLARNAIFLMNVYFQQCEKQHLTKIPFSLHPPFKQSLLVYLNICKAWITFDQAYLDAYCREGFFIDFTKALSLDGERFFDINKMVNRQLIPSLLSSCYKKVIEIGKTVQFIKFYFSEQDLLFFHQFLSIDSQFRQLQHFLSEKIPPTSRRISRLSATISSKCMKPPKLLPLNQSLVQTKYPYFAQSDTSPFLSLRKTSKKEEKMKQQQKKGAQLKQTASYIQNRNTTFTRLFERGLQQIGKKCKIAMEKHRIKNSIQESLKAIKQFVLLGQGDFVQQFLQLSEVLLSRPTDKISANSIQNCIQEAAKSSSSLHFYSTIRQSLSFVFLKTDENCLVSWRQFSFTFRSKPPLNFIFHSRSMYDYQTVGNLLFNLRHCEHALVSFWNKSLLSGSTSLQRLRTAVHHLISFLEAYLFNEIELLWEELLGAFENCQSVVEMLEANNSFLAKLKEKTVENKPLINSMLSILKIAERVENIRLRLEEGNSEGFSSDLKIIWSWLLSLVDQIKNIEPLSQSLNFDFAQISDYNYS